MARKTTRITIDTEGRDKGNTYELNEMPATPAEDWAIRAFSGMAKSGIQLPDGIADLGLAGIAALGFKAFAGMQYADLKPLMDEMFSCVKFVTSKGIVRNLVETDIEEVATRLRLRKEVFELHTSFFEFASRRKSEKDASQASDTPNTSTSPDQSQS